MRLLYFRHGSYYVALGMDLIYLDILQQYCLIVHEKRLAGWTTVFAIPAREQMDDKRKPCPAYSATMLSSGILTKGNSYHVPVAAYVV